MADGVQDGQPEAVAQTLADNLGDEREQRQESIKEFWKTLLRCKLRIAAAAGIEGDILTFPAGISASSADVHMLDLG
ncbi:hypothetical protein LTR67_006969 [Exophiala xenobiotica]